MITGPSGAGKTTLLHLLLGILPPDSGKIRGVRGKRLAAVFQEDRLCEFLSARKNIRIAAPDADEDEIGEHLARVGLDRAGGQRVSEMSGGMKRRVAIVRALICRAQILVLDEPLRGLDAQTRDLVYAYMNAHMGGRTVIAVTHDPDEGKRFGSDAQIRLTQKDVKS